jgi:hypothetical protein
VYVQELKERVAHREYTVDPNAVAAAIWLRWRATHLMPGELARFRETPGPAGSSGEVVEPE